MSKAHNIMQTSDKQASQNITLDFDFFSFLKFIYESRIFILRIIIVFGFISVIYNFAFRPIVYSSTVKIHPVNSSSTSAVPQSLSRVISIAGGGSTGTSGKNTKNLAIINSRQFIDGFIAERNIAKYLLAVDYYDSKLQTLYFKEKLFDPVTGEIKKELINNEMLYRKFIKLLSVNPDLKSDIVNVSVRYISPFAASDIANWLVEDLNKYLASKAVAKAQRNVDFLKSTVQTNQKNYIELSNLYNALTLQEIKKLMLAKDSIEYAYEIIDPAFPVMAKVSPRRLRDSIIGTMMGGIIALFILIFQRIVLAYRNQYSTQS